MAQRNHISGSELPALTGDADADLQAMHNQLYLVLEQLRFELSQLQGDIAALKKAVRELSD